jgi:hypothetical protein
MCIGTPIKSKTVVRACVVIRPILEDPYALCILVHVDEWGKWLLTAIIIPKQYVDNAGISSVIPKIISVVPLKLFNNFGLENKEE